MKRKRKQKIPKAVRTLMMSDYEKKEAGLPEAVSEPGSKMISLRALAYEMGTTEGVLRKIAWDTGICSTVVTKKEASKIRTLLPRKHRGKRPSRNKWKDISPPPEMMLVGDVGDRHFVEKHPTSSRDLNPKKFRAHIVPGGRPGSKR